MPIKTAINYTIIAAVATLVNLAVQEISIRLYSSGAYALWVSVMAGTAAGLLCKYLGDKRYIFAWRSDGWLDDGRLFLRYSLMGVFTTALFWGFEFGFHYLYGSKLMRYVGAVLGLGLGYWLKYQLDKRFVFAEVRR